ncbi:MAG: PorP/SprF family type IX secretion system membrane protein [Saprospiraceae bacterium]|nr:PorP/SprF family type IX secretion system membrane protein [Saprospiraceae bacterium]
MKFFQKLTIICVLMAWTLSQVDAQRYFDERYVYSHSYFNPVLINPGATAQHGGQQLLVNYRNTWSTFPGSPKSATLSYDGMLGNRLGLGIIALQDNFGALQTTKGQLSFSYTIKSDINQLGFGLSAEYIKHGLNNYQAGSVLQEPDDLVNARREGIEYLDASFGIYGVYNDQFTYGIALPSLISSRIDNTIADANREVGFLLNLGYKVKSASSGISLSPSILLKKLNNVPTHVDLNLKLGFLEEKLSGGVTYRVGADKMLGFLLGMNIDRIGFYYSYNVSSYQFQDNNNGSHELTARIDIGTKKAKPVEEMK